MAESIGGRAADDVVAFQSSCRASSNISYRALPSLNEAGFSTIRRFFLSGSAYSCRNGPIVDQLVTVTNCAQSMDSSLQKRSLVGTEERELGGE